MKLSWPLVAHTHAHRHTDTHMCMRTHTHTHAHTHTNKHTHMHKHTNTHAYTHTHNTHTHVHTHIYTRTHTHTCINTQTHMHTHNTDTRTHTYIHITQTHTKYAYIIFSKCEKMVLSILNVLLQPLDGNHIAVLVLRKAHINLKLLHYLGNGLPFSPNQPTVHTMINLNILTYLLLLGTYTNHKIVTKTTSKNCLSSTLDKKEVIAHPYNHLTAL